MRIKPTLKQHQKMVYDAIVEQCPAAKPFTDPFPWLLGHLVGPHKDCGCYYCDTHVNIHPKDIDPHDFITGQARADRFVEEIPGAVKIDLGGDLFVVYKPWWEDAS